MKKSLVALAALAASAAFAQSTVTLSGTVDTGIEKTSASGAIQMSASRNGTTNLTFAGSEDLGNGLKANFSVSTSFDSSYQAPAGTPAVITAPSAGTDTNFIGNNNMWVELAGGFGSLKLGRSFDPVFASTQTANSTKGVTGYTSRAGTLDFNGVYVSNQVLYTTPNVSGLSAQISFAPSEVIGTKNNTGYSINYAAGPLSIGFAGSTVNSTNNTSYTGSYAGKAVQLVSGSYDAGVAKLFVSGTQRSENKSSYNLGVSVPMGAATLWGDYSSNNNSDTVATQLGYKYSLSKRTTAYASYGTKKVAGVNSQGYGAGIQHNF